MARGIADVADLVPSFFVAYCHLDEAHASAIRTCLADTLGFTTVSMKDNRVGEDFVKASRRAIRDCSCTVPILTENYSRWIEQEIWDAEGEGKEVFPILVGERAADAPWRSVSMSHVHCFLPTTELPDLAEQLVKSMVEAKILAGGIVPRKLLEAAASFAHDPLAPCEQFAAELIEKPLVVSGTADDMVIDLDRRPKHSCRYVVLSNRGKRRLQQHFVNPRRGELEKADRELSAVLTGRKEPPSGDMQTPKGLPLRWASGGVLPIVTFRKRRWVALLFRDIAPYGWNLPMGASERYSRADSQATATELWEGELRRPVRLVTREFLEEFLVLDGPPTKRSVDDRHIRRFDFVHDPIEDVRHRYRRFNQEHISMRQDEDGLRFAGSESPARRIPVTERQVPHGRIVANAGGECHTVHGLYASLNLLELGIELILPLEFTLADNDYILDGEILDKDGRKELIRMPIALISVEYLRRAFPPERELTYMHPALPCEDKLYTETERAPAIDAGIPLGAEDVFLFEWDIERRREIPLQERRSTDREQERHQRWADLFGAAFAGAPGQYPTYFTPASAKTIQALQNLL